MKETKVQTYNVMPDRDITDLEMCIMALRNLSNIYPRHFDIAYDALRQEHFLPIMQVATKPELPKERTGDE
jgi:hypothetical protein